MKLRENAVILAVSFLAIGCMVAMMVGLNRHATTSAVDRVRTACGPVVAEEFRSGLDWLDGSDAPAAAKALVVTCRRPR